MQVLLTSDQGAILDTDANSTTDTKTIAVAIASGASANVAFTWIPDVLQNVSELRVVVDPNAAISESDETNNLTTLAVAFENPIPEFSCYGFMPPFDQPLSLKKKVKRAIPVKLELIDPDAYIVTDMDNAAPPVINVLFNSTVFGDVPPDDAELLPLGSANEDNVFRFDLDSEQWVYNLGTKQFKAAGTYTVMVASGDTSEYTIAAPNGACTQYFERLP